MIDWLRSNPADHMVDVGNRTLPIEIRRHPTAKRLVLRLADDGQSVRVTMPRWGRTADALAFAASRADWLADQAAKRPDPRNLEPGGTIPYRGAELYIGWNADLPRKPRLEGEAIHLGGPRETLSPRLKRWMQGQVRILLNDDLAFYSDRAQLPVPPLALSSARRRWGSCSSSGSMRINWRLAMAPDAVRRSVVAHETAHRVHFDHSSAFYRLLGELFEGDLPAADRWFKDHGKTLFMPFG